MTTFREYIRECIIGEVKEIILTHEHLSSASFKDICVVIHFMTKTRCNIKVNEEIRAHQDYQYMEGNMAFVVRNGCVDERRAILLFLTMCGEFYVHHIETLWPADVFHPKYEMSPKFVNAAKKYGVYDHHYTKCIIVAFDMKHKCSFEEADQYLNHYLGSSKSANTQLQ